MKMCMFNFCDNNSSWRSDKDNVIVINPAHVRALFAVTNGTKIMLGPGLFYDVVGTVDEVQKRLENAAKDTASMK
jgi:hypothetical protein